MWGNSGNIVCWICSSKFWKDSGLLHNNCWGNFLRIMKKFSANFKLKVSKILKFRELFDKIFKKISRKFWKHYEKNFEEVRIEESI